MWKEEAVPSPTAEKERRGPHERLSRSAPVAQGDWPLLHATMEPSRAATARSATSSPTCNTDLA